MQMLRVPHLLEDEDRMLCRACHEPVEWSGRWRHLYAYTTHAVPGATYPRSYFKR